jgi:hypothetical protein
MAVKNNIIRELEFVSRSRRGIGMIKEPMATVIGGNTLIFNTEAVNTTNLIDFHYAQGAIDKNNDKLAFFVFKDEPEEDFFTIRENSKGTYAISCAFLLRRTAAVAGDKFAVSQEEHEGKQMLVLKLLVK